VLLIYGMLSHMCLFCILTYFFTKCKRNFENIFHRTKDISKSLRWVICLSQWFIMVCLWLYCTCICLYMFLLNIVTRMWFQSQWFITLCLWLYCTCTSYHCLLINAKPTNAMWFYSASITASPKGRLVILVIRAHNIFQVHQYLSARQGNLRHPRVRFPCLALLPVLDSIYLWSHRDTLSISSELFPLHVNQKSSSIFLCIAESYYVIIWLIVRICVFIKDRKLIYSELFILKRKSG
jgi:hypothetical protein